MNNNTFDYLQHWSQDRLKKRCEQIKPLVEYLVQMFNAETKTATIDLDYIDNDQNSVNNLSIQFSTMAGGEFPETFTTFLHDYCTHLCGEKMVIETLITKQ